MKKQLCLLFLFLSSICFGQTDTTYYNEDNMKCKKEVATYYRLVTTLSENYLVKEINMDTQQPSMIAMCSEVKFLKKNGKCTYYFDNGQKKSEGKYIDNNKSGIWTDWDEDGKDSSVYECFSYDNTYKNIHISSKQSTPYDQLGVFYKLEEVPEFPGGYSEMAGFIARNVVYPSAAKELGISGTCYVNFVIEQDGSVSSAKVLRGVSGCPECDDEAIRVVNIMPNWSPGKQQGRSVKVKFTLPIKYTLYSGRQKKKRDKKKKEDN